MYFMMALNIEDYQISEALKNDMLYIIGSITFVFLYLLFHTRSFLLTFVGLIITLISVPLGYVLCGIFTQTSTVNFTSFLAVFLVVGFGCDVIFVYVDFWVDSARHCDSVEDRLVWTYARAGRASFVTTATTALSFFANIVSVIRALRQFGFFMGLCVMLCWSLISLIFAPLCVVDEYRFGACRLYAKDVGRRRATVLSALAKHIRNWRRTYVAVPAVIIVICLILFLLLMETGLGVPDIFPAEHNRVYGQEVLGRFTSPGATSWGKTSFKAPEAMGICSESNFSKRDLNECSLQWCEAEARLPAAPINQCTCYRHYVMRGRCPAHLRPTVVQRFVAPESWKDRLMNYDDEEGNDGPSIQGMLLKYLEDTGGNRGLNFSDVKFEFGEKLSDLVMHDWESGMMTHINVYERQWSLPRNKDQKDTKCGWHDICYCEVVPCYPEHVRWEVLPELQLPPVLRRLPALAPPRRLASVPYNKRVKIRIAFGLHVETGMQVLGDHNPNDLWSFEPKFEMRQPWAQRNMYEFCDRYPSKLKVARSWCWMKNFRDWRVLTLKERFPVKADRFDDLAAEFIASGMSTTRGTKYIWKEDKTIKAMYVSVEVHVDKNEEYSKLLDYKQYWDDYVGAYNANAVVTARGAFHVSKTWVEAGSQEPLIRSAVLTLGILVVLAFLGMVTFTWSVLLSIYVVMSTIAVVIGLAFFIVVIMSWKIGLLEVIAIVYFIGYAVTYSLHIAHKYGHAEAKRRSMTYEGADMAACMPPGGGPMGNPYDGEGDRLGAGVGDLDASSQIEDLRFQRTTFAMQSIGGAALGSAATTAGSAFFLVFCTLTIFQRLGSMCLIVTLLSILTALVPLPAGLMLFAPLRPGTCSDWKETCFCLCVGRRLHGLFDMLTGQKAAPQTSLAVRDPSAYSSSTQGSPPRRRE